MPAAGYLRARRAGMLLEHFNDLHDDLHPVDVERENLSAAARACAPERLDMLVLEPG